MIVMGMLLMIIWQVAGLALPLPTPSDGYSVPSLPELNAVAHYVLHIDFPPHPMG